MSTPTSDTRTDDIIRNLFRETGPLRRRWLRLAGRWLARASADAGQLLVRNGGVRIHARLAHAIGRATIAIGDEPTDFRGLRAKTVAPPGLCIVVSNRGKRPVTITEVGLTRGGDGPQIAMVLPHLHDRGAWPRTLNPGQEVVAHFGSDLESKPLLAMMRRTYAATLDGRVLLGDATALHHYLARRRAAPRLTRPVPAGR